MQIDLLYFDGCPSWQDGLENLEAALKQEDVAAEIQLVRIDNDAQAAAFKFLGSPSFQVNGQDLWPEDRTTFHLSCRVYPTLTGMQGAPSVEMLAGSTLEEEIVPTLAVTDGSVNKIYTTVDLQKLGQVQLEDKGSTYVGVPLSVLLLNAGYALVLIVNVQAVSRNGSTATYEPILIQKPDTLLAYSLLDGPMSVDEGPFRMVLPGQAGKLNPRMVVQLLVIHN